MRPIFDAIIKPPFVAARHAIVVALERRTGIVTRGEIDARELGFSDDHHVYYKPSGWLTLRRAVSASSVHAQDVFLDLGCGKGRVVCQAALRYPFRRVIGVDASAELVAVAQTNADAIASRRRARAIELVHADVLHYEIPDDVTIVYLYNPFTGPVFQAAVDAMLASLQRAPRRLRVVYGNPIEAQMLLDAGFRIDRHLPGLRPTREWARSNSTLVLERDI
jgi:SAM-dependent methyltransferase